jgi:hypothetical protein
MTILNPQLLILLTVFSTGIVSVVAVYAQTENGMISNQEIDTACPERTMLLQNGSCASQDSTLCPKGTIPLLNGSCASQSLAASCPEGSDFLVNGSCILLNNELDKNTYRKTVTNN